MPSWKLVQYKFKSTDADATPAPPGNDGTPLQQQPRGEVMETFATVPEDIQKWITTEAVHIILTGIDDDIYSTVDACPNTMEMWKAIERKSINLPTTTSKLLQTPETQMLIILQEPTEELGKQVVQQTRIQCYNCKEFRHVARERNQAKRPKDLAYHKEKMLLCKQEEARIQLSAEQVDWRDDTDEEPEDQELEAHYMYMAKIQEVTPDVADNSGPIFDAEPLQKTYLVKQGDTNITPYSSDMSNNEEETDQDDDLAKERDLLTFLIEKLKCEINDSKNRNKLLKSSNKTLYEKLKCEIDNGKNQNKIFESSNKALKEACKEIADVNKEMSKDIDKFQNELDRYKNANFVKDVENECAKAYGLLAEHKVNSKKSSNDYTRKIINLNQKISEMEKELIAHQKTISTISHEKEAQENVSRPQLKSTRLEDRVLHNNSQGKKQEVEDHRRIFEFLNNKTSITACNNNLNAKTLNVNFICMTCGKCVLNDNHDLYFLHYINGMNSRTKKSIVVPISTREPKRTMNQSVATPHKRIVASESTIHKPKSTIRKLYEHVSRTCIWWYTKITPPGYKCKPKSKTGNFKPNVSLPLGIKFGTTNILEPKTIRGSTLSNTPSSSNSFAARRDNPVHRRLWGNDLLTGSRGTDLYSITLQATNSPNPICLMAKASSSQAWLWHHRLSNLNFDTINLLSKNDIVNGLPKVTFFKDHLCSSCELGKAKRKSFKTKTTPSSKGWLHLCLMAKA
ncbi:reverse transcriptase domain-containing protein [Tanacetum coccineum]